MLKFLTNNNPIMIGLLLVSCFLLNLPIFGNLDVYINAENHLIFPGLIKSVILIQPKIIPAIIVFVFLIFTAFMIVRLDNAFNISGNRNFISGFFFVFLSSFYTNFFDLSISLLSSLLLIVSLFLIFRTIKSENAIFDFFNIGIIISIASLFNANALYLYILVLISIFVIRTVVWNELASSLFGFLLPFILLIGIYFILSGNLNIVHEIYIHFTGNHKVVLKFSLSEIIFLIFSFLLIIIGLVSVINQFSKIKISQRRIFIVLINLILLSIGTLFFSPPSILETFLPILIPGSIILAKYFTGMKNKFVAEIIFTLFILILVFSKTGIKISYFE